MIVKHKYAGENKLIKKILMGILGVFLYLLIPAIFGGVGIGVYFLAIEPYTEARNILIKGIETSARIISIEGKGSVTTTSGNTKKTTDLYGIKLSFINLSGDVIEYQTRGIYPKSFISKNNIVEGETIKIRYVGSKAVIKYFTPNYETWLWLFPIIFGGIGIGFLLIPIIGFMWILNDYIIMIFGSAAMGTYLNQKRLIKSIESDFNRIICTFKSNNDETVEVKTRYGYSNSEVEKLAEMKSFPIKYIRKKAVIMIDKNKN